MQSRFDGHLNAFGGTIERIECWLHCSYGHVNFLDKLLVCIDVHFGFAQSLGIDGFERSLSTGDCFFASDKLHLEPIQQGLRPKWSNSCLGWMSFKLQYKYVLNYIYIKYYIYIYNYKYVAYIFILQNKQTQLVNQNEIQCLVVSHFRLPSHQLSQLGRAWTDLVGELLTQRNMFFGFLRWNLGTFRFIPSPFSSQAQANSLKSSKITSSNRLP